MITSLSVYMKTSAEVYSKSTNYSSPSFSLWRLCKETIKLTQMNGDISWLVQLGKLKLLKILLTGLVNWNGLKLTNNSMPCPGFQYLRDLTTTSSRIISNSKRYLIIKNLIIALFQENGIRNWTHYKKWLCLNQWDQIRWLWPFKITLQKN